MNNSGAKAYFQEVTGAAREKYDKAVEDVLVPGSLQKVLRGRGGKEVVYVIKCPRENCPRIFKRTKGVITKHLRVDHCGCAGYDKPSEHEWIRSRWFITCRTKIKGHKGKLDLTRQEFDAIAFEPCESCGGFDYAFHAQLNDYYYPHVGLDKDPELRVYEPLHVRGSDWRCNAIWTSYPFYMRPFFLELWRKLDERFGHEATWIAMTRSTGKILDKDNKAVAMTWGPTAEALVERFLGPANVFGKPKSTGTSSTKFSSWDEIDQMPTHSHLRVVG